MRRACEKVRIEIDELEDCMKVKEEINEGKEKVKRMKIEEKRAKSEVNTEEKSEAEDSDIYMGEEYSDRSDEEQLQWERDNDSD